MQSALSQPQRLLGAAFGATLLALSSPTALAQETVAPGYSTAAGQNPGGAIRELSDGRFLSFDGQFVDLFLADGTLAANLADLGNANFSGAFVIDPTETFAIVGESSNGDMFRVEIDGTGHTFLSNLVFNYDAKFSPAGELYVSAATGGFGTGNDVIRVDTTTGAQTQILDVAGPSGPIAFDSLGNLYYATVSGDFPSPPASTDVLLFPAGSIAAPAVPLQESDGFVFAAGFDGATTMVADRSTDRIYLGESNFGNGVNRLRLLAGSVAASPILVEGQPFEWLTVSQFMPGSGPADFAPFQPTGGGRLIYGRTDFATFNERRILEPARTTLAVSGAGTAGVGAFDLDFTGADPSGSILLVWGATSLVGPEIAFGSTPPLFTGLDLGTLAVLPFQLGVDGAGDTSLGLFNPGGLEGQLTFQGLVLNSGGAALATSTMAGL